MAELQKKGYIMNKWKMVDASFTTAPRQRNTPDENKVIKEGHGKELWNDQPNNQRQKDVDAIIGFVGTYQAKNVIGLINLTYNMFRL